MPELQTQTVSGVETPPWMSEVHVSLNTGSRSSPLSHCSDATPDQSAQECGLFAVTRHKPPESPLLSFSLLSTSRTCPQHPPLSTPSPTMATQPPPQQLTAFPGHSSAPRCHHSSGCRPRLRFGFTDSSPGFSTPQDPSSGLIFSGLFSHSTPCFSPPQDPRTVCYVETPAHRNPNTQFP